MKNTRTRIVLACTLAAMLPVMAGCFGTIEDLEKFTVQVPANYEADFTDDRVPSSRIELVDLNTYKSYRDNRDKLEKAEIYQFGWWLEQIEPRVNNDNDETNNIDVSEIVFEKITFHIMFPYLNDPSEPNPDSRFELTSFENARVGDVLLKPQVYKIEDQLAQTMSALLLQHDRYFIETTVSETTAPQPVPPTRFDKFVVKADIVARLEGELEL